MIWAKRLQAISSRNWSKCLSLPPGRKGFGEKLFRQKKTNVVLQGCDGGKILVLARSGESE